MRAKYPPLTLLILILSMSTISPAYLLAANNIPCSLASQSIPTVSVSPKDIIRQVEIGLTFKVNITITNVHDLYVWQAGLTFNPNVLEAISFAEGSFLKENGATLWTPGTIDNTFGIIYYHASTLTGNVTGVSGNGTLGTITFQIENYGRSTLQLTDVILLDSSLTDINKEVIDGTVIITAPPRPIRIGILGPMFWAQGLAIQEGATLAVGEINGMGGINGNNVDLYFASTHPNAGTDPTSAMGAAAMTELMGYDVDFVMGGFRTEAVFGAREVAMDNQRIFIITGAATDELIDNPDVATYPDTVRGNYERHKYLFRTTPNSTTLFKSIADFLAYAMVTKLMPLYTGYASPLKIAVVSESTVWADVIHATLSNHLFWDYTMGMLAYGGVDVVYETRIHPVNPTGVPAVLAAVQASDARLLIHVISGPVGRAFTIEWAAVECDAALVGIDVAGQESIHWTATGGNCEHETFLAASGTETPIVTGLTNAFWANYIAMWGRWPIYTAQSAYDAVYTLAAAIEAWENLVRHGWPPVDQGEYDLIIPMLEQTDRIGTAGQFQFTGPNPGHNGDFTDYDPDAPGNQPYPYLEQNPQMIGTLHDVFVNELGPTWTEGHVRPLFVQWQAGRLEVVWPVDQTYSKIWKIPNWMYPYPTDVMQDGKRDIADIAIVSYAIGSGPGDPRWQLAADVDSTGASHWYIDGDDLTPVAFDYGQPIPVPLG